MFGTYIKDGQKMTDLVEYRMISGSPYECEDKLNKWAKKFNLTIVEMCSYGDRVTILLLKAIPQLADKEKAS